MIQESYVSFEVAKLLKEKGFDEECTQFYATEKGATLDAGDLCFDNRGKHNSHPWGIRMSAPTHQMALAWLRENGVIISVAPTQDMDGDYIAYCATIQNVIGEYGLKRENEIYVDAYEEAVEASLKYTLENLI